MARGPCGYRLNENDICEEPVVSGTFLCEKHLHEPDALDNVIPARLNMVKPAKMKARGTGVATVPVSSLATLLNSPGMVSSITAISLTDGDVEISFEWEAR